MARVYVPKAGAELPAYIGMENSVESTESMHQERNCLIKAMSSMTTIPS